MKDDYEILNESYEEWHRRQNRKSAFWLIVIGLGLSVLLVFACSI